MKFTVAQAVFTAALVANEVVAAPAVLGTETAPFFLQVRSDDATIDGKKLGACHIGAGIESICLEPKDVQIFTLNSTSSSPPSNLPANVAVTGNLVYNPGAGLYSQAMGLYQSIGSNVASALFGLGQVQSVAFSKDEGTLGYVNYVDDAVDPPKYQDGAFVENWFLCKYNFNGYVYETLSWEFGTGKPTQPSCKAAKIDIKYQ